MTRVRTPAFVDLQVNGFAGVDFNAADLTADDVRATVLRLRATGVTQFLPTLITSSFDRFVRAARLIASIDDPAIAGIHQEGPYISPEDGARGAHPHEHTCAASIDDFRRRQEAAAGRIVLVTLAPEVPGALELTEYLVASGVRVAIGHTAASTDVLRRAVAAGASLSTHLGNGCAASLPRHPNLIWEQLASDQMYASFIVDGHHLPPATVKAMIRAKSPSRSILISDAIAAAGQPTGHYRLGEVEIEVSPSRRVSLRGTPFLAGSAVTLPEAVGLVVRYAGVSLDDGLAMASTVPAAYLGIATAGWVTADWDAERCLLENIRVEDDPLPPSRPA